MTETEPARVRRHVTGPVDLPPVAAGTEPAPGPTPGPPARPAYRDVVRRLSGSQKNPLAVPAYTRRVNRPLGRRLAALAFLAGLTPNQVTGLSLLSSCAGMVVLVLAPVTPWTGLLVGGLMVLGYALDSADGQLARLTGTGGPAGEWLDHVTDQFRQTCLHAAVLLYAVRALPDLPAAAYLLPLAYAVVVSTRFLSQILAEQLRRSAQAPPVEVAGAGRRALLQLPADPGVLCLSFLVTGFPAVWFGLYAALFASNAVLAAVSVVRRHRELTSLPRR